MSIHEQFSAAIQEISSSLNLPHFCQDDNGRVVVRYMDDFDVEVFCNAQGAIQLHAYLVLKQALSSYPELYCTLLTWNSGQIDLGGTYIGVHDSSETITLNGFFVLESIDCVALENIMNNFLDEAESVKKNIQVLISEHEISLEHRPKHDDDPLMGTGLRV